MATFPFPADHHLRIAMLGMVEGNGHPYSWAAMFNGYDRERMRHCPYAGIPEYLDRQPPETIRIGGASVTHIWTDNPAEAEKVAACSLIPTIVKKPEDVIGEVDAVIVATDIGHEHVERCRPFIEAGLPIFIDKPMTDNLPDLATFIRWVEQGHPLMSSSCMRYAKEFAPWRLSTAELGALRWGAITMAKSWERYGIHALESIYPILGPGFLTARNTGTKQRNVVHLTHARGVDLTVITNADMYGSFGALTLCGTGDHVSASFRDTFYAFQTQLRAFVHYLRSGRRPFPFAHTVELMLLVIAGIRSRDQGGAPIELAQLLPDTPWQSLT